MNSFSNTHSHKWKFMNYVSTNSRAPVFTVAAPASCLSKSLVYYWWFQVQILQLSLANLAPFECALRGGAIYEAVEKLTSCDGRSDNTKMVLRRRENAAFLAIWMIVHAVHWLWGQTFFIGLQLRKRQCIKPARLNRHSLASFALFCSLWLLI